MMKVSIINKLRVWFPVLLPVAGILSVSIFYSCSTGAEIGCRDNIVTPCIPETKPHSRLSEYHLFIGNLNELKPVDGLMPYDLNTPLFSDYADKARLIYNSALFLSIEEQDPFRYGVCKPPVAAGAGSGGLRFAIVPCKPEESILIFRMNSVEPEKRMPELGRILIHKEGVELIKAWIESQGCVSCNKTKQRIF